ncbi:hypothetical protein AMTRI_Chr02g259460 [Amborella trichopoda]
MFNLPWIIGRDFNTIRCSTESSINHHITSCMRAFSKFISDFSWLDLPASGARFTWSNGCVSNPIMTRIDRFLHCQNALLIMFHYNGKEKRVGGVYFKFEMAWINEKLMNDLISEIRKKKDIQGPYGYVATKKIQGVRKELLDWRKRNVINYKRNIEDTMSKIKELDMKE